MRTWTTPAFAELRMDSEVGAYQDDFDRDRDIPAYQKRESLSPVQRRPTRVDIR